MISLRRYLFELALLIVYLVETTIYAMAAIGFLVSGFITIFWIMTICFIVMGLMSIRKYIELDKLADGTSDGD